MTTPPPTPEISPEQWRSRVEEVLTRARDRSRLLTDAVDDDDLVRQHSPLMSPLVWDLAHVGNQEELWLVRDVGGRAPVRRDIDQLYDAFKHARADRPALPLLGPAGARSYVREVRDKVLDVLEHSPLEGRPLLDQAFAFGMVAQHEQQHDETMLATHQLRAGAAVLDAPNPPPPASLPAAEVLVPGGPFTMGTSTEPWALDNERPAHVVEVAPFFIDTAAVTNGAYLAFIDAGGYDEPAWWSAAGWAHRQEAGLTAPRFWQREGDTWWRMRFGVREQVPPSEPVMHVSFHEAQAYAAWAGRRLPTEAEWEKAARWDPATGRSRRYPWGDEDPGPQHANLGPTPPAPGRRRRLPPRRLTTGRAPAHRRRLGVDLERLRRLPGLRSLPVPRVLPGLLRFGLQGAARRVVRLGRRGGAGHVPQLGLPDPATDLRRVPLRSRPRTRGGRLRHVSSPGLPRPTGHSGGPCAAPTTFAAASVMGADRHARWGHHQRRRLRHRLARIRAGQWGHRGCRGDGRRRWCAASPPLPAGPPDLVGCLAARPGGVDHLGRDPGRGAQRHGGYAGDGDCLCTLSWRGPGCSATTA